MRNYGISPLSYLTYVCASALLLIAASARADDRGIAAPDSVHALEVVTVTGTRADSREAVPSKRLDAAALERLGVQDVAQAVRRLPGVTLRDYGGAGGIKTVSVHGLGAEHTAVSLDGMVLGSPRTGAVDLRRYNLDGVESMTLTTGDGLDIWIPARQASAPAVLSVDHAVARPGDPLQLTVSASTGSFGRFAPGATLSVPVGNSCTVETGGRWERSNNDYPFTLVNGTLSTREKRNNSRVSDLDGHAAFTWVTPGGGRLRARLTGHSDHRHLPGPVIYYNDINREQLHEGTLAAHCTWQGRISQTVALRAGLRYSYDESQYSDVNGRYPGGELHQNYYQNEAYATASLLWSVSRTVTGTVAADWIGNTLSSNLADDIRPVRHTLLATAALRWHHGRFGAVGRLLLSSVNNSARRGTPAPDVNRLDPSMAVTADIGRGLSLRLSGKSACRVPTFSETYFYRLGAPELLPERTLQINAGAAWSTPQDDRATRLVITADLFANRVHDKIVAVPYNLFIWRMTNLGRVTGRGADVTVEASYRVAPGWTLTLDGTYTLQRIEPRRRGTAEFGRQVAYVPLHSGAATVACLNRWLNLSLSATACSHTYTESTNRDGTRIPGHCELTLSAWRPFSIGSTRWTARADLLNLLDAQYEIIARYPMPGRSWRVTLTCTI